MESRDWSVCFDIRFNKANNRVQRVVMNKNQKVGQDIYDIRM